MKSAGSKRIAAHALASAALLFFSPFLCADETSAPAPAATSDVLPDSVKIERVEFGRLDPAVA